MQLLKISYLLMGALFLSACQNIKINFDELPDGTPLPTWPGTGSIYGDYVITNQYSSKGVTEFSSAGGGVFLIESSVTSSPPNVACPYGSSSLVNYSEPTTIRLNQSTCNIWVTIPSGLSLVTVSAFDANGLVIATETTTGPNSSTADGGGRKVRINQCGIRSVRLSGSNYCFDDFTWQKR